MKATAIGPGAVADLSNASGDCQVYTAAMLEEPVTGKAQLLESRLGDGYDPEHWEQIHKLAR